MVNLQPTRSAHKRERRLTRSGEHRLEQRYVCSVVRLAITTSNTPIAAAKQYGAPTCTKLGKHAADSGGIFVWNGLFVVSVRGCDGLGDRRFTGDGFEPVEVRFVGVVCWISG